MSTNGRKYVFLVFFFDTCDVVYSWSISLLPPIVLDNLFGISGRANSLEGGSLKLRRQSYERDIIRKRFFKEENILLETLRLGNLEILEFAVSGKKVSIKSS